jgi:hypothetical protein
VTATRRRCRTWTSPSAAACRTWGGTPDGLTPTTFETGLVRPIADLLKAKPAFDRESYLPTDRPTLHVKITNDTGGDITVFAHCGGYGSGYEVYNDTEEWGGLAYGAAGVPIAAGRTWTADVALTMPERSPDHGLIAANCEFGPLDGRAGSAGARRSPVPRPRCRVRRGRRPAGSRWSATSTRRRGCRT